jgi:uncharacterized membrane protein
MAGYKTRLQRDLDDWIAAGLVPTENRDAILQSVAESRRVDAATALAVVGGLLAGIAAIAFVAANWGEIPRIARFALILGLFLGVAVAAAWASRGRPNLANVLLLVAALVYAAAIGLTGQIFDIAGDPQRALRSAGLAAGLLALAGRSSGAGAAALALLGIGEFAGEFDGGSSRWLIFAAPVGLAFAWLWNSRPLAHAGSLALAVGVFAVLAVHERQWDSFGPLGASLAFFGLAAAARQFSTRQTAVVFMLWCVWAAFAFYAAGGFDEVEGGFRIGHRALWILLSGAAVALGLHDRQPMVTAAGVVAMIGGVCAILFDLGVGLMTAAGLFAACAVAALVAGWFARGRRAPA